jgi:hypothetical protein
MTEQEIVYGILETIRAYEITDDEKVTEEILRNYLSNYRNEDIKNVFEISEEHYQNIDLVFKKKNEIFESDLPGIIYERGRIGISISDWNIPAVPVTSKEEAMNARRSRMYKPPYIAYLTNGVIHVIVQNDVLETMPAGLSYLKNLLLSSSPKLEIQAILSDVSQGKNYDWTLTPYPLSANRIQTIRKNILRQEFGITVEVKKDEVQNRRQDNIIYQDESKLYK